MSSTPRLPTEQQEDQQNAASKTASEARASTQGDSSSDQPIPSHTETQGKTGRGIVHEGYIYGITEDSPLYPALQQLTTKKEKYEFILNHGEKRGKVDFDTRRRGC
jgi:hypothetical protein